MAQSFRHLEISACSERPARKVLADLEAYLYEYSSDAQSCISPTMLGALLRPTQYLTNKVSIK
jgi:hypothetical protein